MWLLRGVALTSSVSVGRFLGRGVQVFGLSAGVRVVAVQRLAVVGVIEALAVAAFGVVAAGAAVAG
jgi:hypothetical protein